MKKIDPQEVDGSVHPSRRTQRSYPYSTSNVPTYGYQNNNSNMGYSNSGHQQSPYPPYPPPSQGNTGGPSHGGAPYSYYQYQQTYRQYPPQHPAYTSYDQPHNFNRSNQHPAHQSQYDPQPYYNNQMQSSQEGRHHYHQQQHAPNFQQHQQYGFQQGYPAHYGEQGHLLNINNRPHQYQYYSAYSRPPNLQTETHVYASSYQQPNSHNTALAFHIPNTPSVADDRSVGLSGSQNGSTRKPAK
ncbi:hypothetical protein AMATHDRAFT_51285 [Amanita thiersii Skay4041]|uniref:Uncharacterized protein n=1 Tax=Amanita thiersii Skay4041 TaxID=703135 RepID=A0A2A9NCY5_9AGAR|nr:hypothetical protein AMATHDRAFT_51285 [Amanita thiersii Skay4041]